ncbi:zinc cadmium resistance protein [Rutstroemia sp. NJR-2017a WRK4]|nr:zinc cadmium resistance protein [Rutstroemia sp. NJR-2017a WRK4]
MEKKVQVFIQDVLLLCFPEYQTINFDLDARHGSTNAYHPPITPLDYFNLSAKTYEDGTGGCTRGLAQHCLPLLPPLTPDSIVLDNACGSGIVTDLILHVTGPKIRLTIHTVDGPPNMVEIATERFVAVEIVRVTLMLAEELKFPNDTFTCSITNLGLPFFNNSDQGAKEIFRTLKPEKHRRRNSSIRIARYSNLEEMCIHPASFRRNLFAASSYHVDCSTSEDNSCLNEDAIADGETLTEDSPLLSQSNGSNYRHTDQDHEHGHDCSNSHSHSPESSSKKNSIHERHNHNKPKNTSKKCHGHNHANMGLNCMILQVIGDALGNVGVIVSALIIWLTNWSGRHYADPAVSLFITLIILNSTIPLTSATAKILLQATPNTLRHKTSRKMFKNSMVS